MGFNSVYKILLLTLVNFVMEKGDFLTYIEHSKIWNFSSIGRLIVILVFMPF
jgi:hypothetical protein